MSDDEPSDSRGILERLVTMRFRQKRAAIDREEQEWFRRAVMTQEQRDEEDHKLIAEGQTPKAPGQWPITSIDEFTPGMADGLPRDLINRVVEIHFNMKRLELDREEKEFWRRARLTPEQRDKEDRDRIAEHYAAMGEEHLALDSWTLDQFTAALTVDVEGIEAAIDEQERRRIRTVLESCVGVSLKPLNAAAPAERQRFITRELLRVAQVKQLGHIRVLQPLLEALAEPSPAPAPISAREADVARFVEWLKRTLAHNGIGEAEFCKHGSMAALHRVFCEHFEKAAPPYSESPFGGRLNKAGFRFDAGARGPKAQRYVFKALGIPEKK